VRRDVVTYDNKRLQLGARQVACNRLGSREEVLSNPGKYVRGWLDLDERHPQARAGAQIKMENPLSKVMKHFAPVEDENKALDLEGRSMCCTTQKSGEYRVLARK
jgi:hypothetical protein